MCSWLQCGSELCLFPFAQAFFFSENVFSPLTSGVCLQLAEAPAMGQPVFGLDVRLEHTSANIGQRGNVLLLLCILIAVCVCGPGIRVLDCPDILTLY